MESTYFSLLEIIPVLFWVIIIITGGILIKSSKSHLPQYRYYILNIITKMFFGVVFGLVYLFVYGGGDTTAYYDGAIVLNNLFLKSPYLYFEQLFSEPTSFQFTTFYDSSTGFPPGWIYREPEAFFVSKIMSVFSFFTMKSYFAMTLIMSTFTAHASWKLFQLVRSYQFSNEKLLALGILFLPSVNFWCTGISKDTVVFVATLYLIYNAFKIISKQHESGIVNYFGVVILSFIIYHTRSFMLIAVFIPLFFSISARITRAIGGGNLAVIVFRTIIILLGVIGIGRNFILNPDQDLIKTNSTLQQASIIQEDFKNNQIYGNKKYDLGDIEFTPLGLLKVMPLATVTGIFRPFVWEALNPTLILNGLESLVFLYFSFLFIRRNPLKKWNFIKRHEFLIFCFIFVLMIGFMTGMTSILYGVLVRLRAPLLPFLVIILAIDFNSIQASLSKQQMESSNEN